MGGPANSESAFFPPVKLSPDFLTAYNTNDPFATSIANENEQKSLMQSINADDIVKTAKKNYTLEDCQIAYHATTNSLMQVRNLHRFWDTSCL
ncbi:hypothetical protein COOONC_09985 [Cooperia oncophora]